MTESLCRFSNCNYNAGCESGPSLCIFDPHTHVYHRHHHHHHHHLVIASGPSLVCHFLRWWPWGCSETTPADRWLSADYVCSQLFLHVSDPDHPSSTMNSLTVLTLQLLHVMHILTQIRHHRAFHKKKYVAYWHVFISHAWVVAGSSCWWLFGFSWLFHPAQLKEDCGVTEVSAVAQELNSATKR